MLELVPAIVVALAVAIATFFWSIPFSAAKTAQLGWVRRYLGIQAIVGVYYLGASPVIESLGVRALVFGLLPAALGFAVRFAYERRAARGSDEAAEA
jgi:hypothetical protein